MFPIGDTKSSGRLPFWTLAIIVTNVYVFFLELASPNPDTFIQQFALLPSLVDFSNTATLLPFITSQFLHAGFIHILSNMWFLWIFGDNVEDHFGFLFFPFVYILSGIAGGLAQYLLAPGSTLPMLGASGAIAGVLGAYFSLFPNHSIKTLVPIVGFFTVVNLPAFLVLIYWFVTQIFAGTAALTTQTVDVGGVAYVAHVGGFVSGWLIASLTKSDQTYQT